MLSKILISLIDFLTRVKSVFLSELIKLKFYLKICMYYVLLTLTATIALPCVIFRGKQQTNGVIASRIMSYITTLYSLEWCIRNGEILAKEQGAIIISNHQSVLDISGINHAWLVVRKIIVIAKKEILYTGPLGILTYLCGAIFIDRKKSNEAYKLLDSATQIMTRNKAKIWIFPEGTRNTKCDGKFLPFKMGAFNIAVTAQVPIIPVVISPYYFIDKKKYVFNKGKVIMQCLEPVSTEGLTLDDVPALADRLHQAMLHTYQQLSKELTSLEECN